MRKNIFFPGVFLFVIGVWIYFSLNAFETDTSTFPEQLIIQEGNERSETEVAEALAKAIKFDLQGAYKSGYTPMDVINFLIDEPHDLSIVHYKGKFYAGRRTVSRIIPVSVSVVVVLAGIIMVSLSLRKKNTG